MTTSSDPVERRLRDARPPLDAPSSESPEARALLTEARRRGARPERRRRRAPRPALRVAALAVVAAAVVVAWPGSGSGTDEATASPIALALQWFTPQEGTILHTRSTLTTPQSSLEQESWQSVDEPGRSRLITTQDGLTVDAAADGVYDRVRDTIYLTPDPDVLRRRALRSARKRGLIVREKAGRKPESAEPAGPSGLDPLIRETRRLLRRGDARIASQDGSGAAIEIRPAGGARHTLRVDAEGRPLELRIDRDGETLQTTTWMVYEALPAAGADELLSVVAAHPDARVVRDPAAYAAAQTRLFPNG